MDKKINENKITSKIIKDPLYDYIKIDPDICEKIIDNKYFQRLRRIEQTSMRCLYPSARHDRFVHSLGTYHLAKMAIKAINTSDLLIVNCTDFKKDNKDLKEEIMDSINDREKLNFTFEISALLHDVGHSPFSHTLEPFFNVFYKAEQKSKIDIIDVFFTEIDSIFTAYNNNESFVSFKKDCRTAEPAPHEIASCIIIIRCFKEIIEELASGRFYEKSIDFCFLSRCILGATYNSDDSDFNTNITENSYKNCLIKLLNSSIDVDKLDYISRDSKVSGYNNTSVDTSRLINSFALALDNRKNSNELLLVFKKTGIPIIQNVITSRNSLHTWIYSHHKVKYESDLLVNSVNLIANSHTTEKNSEHLQDEEQLAKNLFISKYFSVDSIQNNLVCDDTIWSLFMEKKDEISEIQELIDRSRQKLAIWKSYAEFQAYFNNFDNPTPVGSFDFKQMQNYLKACKNENCKKEDLLKYINNFETYNNFTVVIASTSLASIKSDDILIYINNKLHSYNRILGQSCDSAESSIFFYVYCPKETKTSLNNNNYKLKDEFIEYIKKFDGFLFSAAN